MHFAVISVLLVLVRGEANGEDPIHNFCRRLDHQTCIIDSRLYIDGGSVYYGGSVDKSRSPTLNINKYLLWENISNATTRESFPEQHADLSKDGTEVPQVAGGVLWPDAVNKLFYLFGGMYHDADEVQKRDAQGFSLWFYDTIYDTWNKSNKHTSQASVRWPAFGAGAVSEAGVAYYYGGYLSNKTDYGTRDGEVDQNALISYDMNTQEWASRTWDQTLRVHGSLHYIPASQGGMLVYFGGWERGNLSSSRTLANMSQVHLFDIANSKWYTQTATGDVPMPRHGFCAGAVWAKDKSSYNIYVYGGSTADGTHADDLYVLSIPSFYWILLWPTPKRTQFPEGKAFMSCNIVRESQIILIGGDMSNQSIVHCDEAEIGGQHGLLLGQEAVEQGSAVGGPAWWHRPIDTVTGYRVPDPIATHIGGNTDGHATRTKPDVDWAHTDLPIYFRTTYAARARTPTRAIPTPSSATQNPNKKTNVGAIVGGVLGAAVLAGIVALGFYFVRRRQQGRLAQPGQEIPQTSDANIPDGKLELPGDFSIPQGRTIGTPTPPWPASSPNSPPTSPYDQASPPPHYHSGDWTQEGKYKYNHTLPSNPTQSPEMSNVHEMGGDVPGSLEIAEMPGAMSQTATELPDTDTSLALHGDKQVTTGSE